MVEIVYLINYCIIKIIWVQWLGKYEMGKIFSLLKQKRVFHLVCMCASNWTNAIKENKTCRIEMSWELNECKTVVVTLTMSMNMQNILCASIYVYRFSLFKFTCASGKIQKGLSWIGNGGGGGALCDYRLGASRLKWNIKFNESRLWCYGKQPLLFGNMNYEHIIWAIEP